MTGATLLAGLAAAAALTAAETWHAQFFHDQDQSSLVILDMKFPTASRGVAVGWMQDKGRRRQVMLASDDGGAGWRIQPLPDAGFGLFFLNDTRGWMVAQGGLWTTPDAGVTWSKSLGRRGLRAVHFVSESRGWVVGFPKLALETTDGGRHWSPVAAAAAPKSTPERSTYEWVEFLGPKRGFLGGWSDPRRSPPRLAPWLDPEAAQRPQWPNLTLLLQTDDAGANWAASEHSLFGRITRLRLFPNGTALTLVEFTEGFQFPTEVNRIDLVGRKSATSFRQKDRVVTDILIARSGLAYLTAVEPLGTLHSLPVPGKLKILRSRNFETWEEMSVDYRATATRAVLAEAPDGQLWAATDTGMILKLMDPTRGAQQGNK